MFNSFVAFILITTVAARHQITAPQRLWCEKPLVITWKPATIYQFMTADPWLYQFIWEPEAPADRMIKTDSAGQHSTQWGWWRLSCLKPNSEWGCVSVLNGEEWQFIPLEKTHFCVIHKAVVDWAAERLGRGANETWQSRYFAPGVKRSVCFPFFSFSLVQTTEIKQSIVCIYL